MPKATVANNSALLNKIMLTLVSVFNSSFFIKIKTIFKKNCLYRAYIYNENFSYMNTTKQEKLNYVYESLIHFRYVYINSSSLMNKNEDLLKYIITYY